MMRGGVIFISLLLIVLFGAFGFADESTKNIESRVVESFDKDDPNSSEWIVVGSKFVSQVEGKQLEYKLIDGYPFALYGQAGQNQSHQVLAVKAAFDRKGYNYLEFIPVEDGPNGKVPKKIPFQGRVLDMDMWVWGGNFNYTLEAHIEDYRGIVHVLEVGRLNYVGWKNLRINIPTYIPQSQTYIPRYKELKLVKLVLRTEPSENVAGFEIYIDHIKCLTDVFESRFDGDEFVRPESRAAIWGKE